MSRFLRKFREITIEYDGNFFAVTCENGERIIFDNAAEARERFLGEVDRVCRRDVNACIAKAGFDVNTGLAVDYKPHSYDVGKVVDAFGNSII
ncbi:MAG: hypothetical protein J6C96_12585 [Oscillospiraceae bacterium]|nr:hypothetical protein [Oscillospiraceae bacterium]